MRDEYDRLIASSLGRRQFLKYAGVGALSASVLAACKKAADTGAAGATGSATPAPRPPLEEEAGDLKIYEWLGYGDGSYGDDVLWAEYKAKGYPKPKFTKTFDDDTGYTKVAAGERYDIVHPCAYRFADWVALKNPDGSR